MTNGTDISPYAREPRIVVTGYQIDILIDPKFKKIWEAKASHLPLFE